MNTQRSTNGTKVAAGYVRGSTQEQVSEGVSRRGSVRRVVPNTRDTLP